MTKLNRGVTLVELMVALAASSIVTYAAMRLITGYSHYGRVSHIQADLIDRGRLAREFITRDVMQAGFYWTHEGQYSDPPVRTGTFGEAGLGQGLTDWPTYPIVGENSTTAPDLIHVLIPRADVSGVVAAGGQCCEGSGCTSLTTQPGVAGLPGTWAIGELMVVAGTGMTFMTTLSSTGSPTVFNSLVTDGCEDGGALGGEGVDLASALVAYPVLGVTYAIAAGTTDLYRCETNDPSAGPMGHDASSVAGDAACALLERGIEDLQFRYVWSTHEMNTPAAAVVECDDPRDVSTLFSGGADEAATFCLSDSKRQRPTEDGSSPGVRLIGVRVMIVTRSMSQDQQNYRDRSQRPAVFDRAGSGSNDSFRRNRVEWVVTTPNAYAYGT